MGHPTAHSDPREAEYEARKVLSKGQNDVEEDEQWR